MLVEFFDLTVEIREFPGSLEDYLIYKGLTLKQLFDLVEASTHNWKNIEEHIYCNNKKTYNIIRYDEKEHRHINYGSYETLKKARLVKALLSKSGWDSDVLEDINKLASEYAKVSEKYIHLKDGGYMIVKNIKGKATYFGWYKTLQGAIDERDRLIANNWEK